MPRKLPQPNLINKPNLIKNPQYGINNSVLPSQNKTETSQRDQGSLGLIPIILIILLILLIIAVIIYLIWSKYFKNTKSENSKSENSNSKYIKSSKYKKSANRTYYTRCEDKPLNSPTSTGLATLDIEFIPLPQIKQLSSKSQTQTKSETQTKTKKTKNKEAPVKLLYIPCGYNNTDWDISQFVKENLPLLTKGEQIILTTAAIQGSNKLCSKNNLWEHLDKTLGRAQAKQIIPETWSIPGQKNLFKSAIKTNKSLEPQAFILKKNIQGKKGLLLTNDIKFIEKQFDGNNTKSGKDASLDRYVVVQRYIPQPYLINGRKLNIRLYLAITCQRPIIRIPGRKSVGSNKLTTNWWLYKKGKCIYTNQKYQPQNEWPAKLHLKSGDTSKQKELERHFTSLNLDSDRIYNQEQLPETLEELRDYMAAQKHPWDEIIRLIQSGLNQIANSFNDTLKLAPNVDSGFQIFGLDYIIDAEKMIPYLLEFNKGPEMQFKSPKDPQLKETLMIDLLQLGLAETKQSVADNWISIS